MTKTDPERRARTLLALSQRQRRFEWQLARDEQTRAAARLVAGKTHDLLNLIQIIQLATLELGNRCDAAAREFIDDLTRSAASSQQQLDELMAVARPAQTIARGAPVATTIAAAIATVREAIALDVELGLPPAAATRCTAEELEHLVIGLALDVASADVPVTMMVRARSINGAPWIEIVRSSPVVPAGDRFELRVVEVIAQRAGGEVAHSDRRGGGEELVVALPEA